MGIAILLPTINLCLTFLTTYGDCPQGYIGPGGLSLPEGQVGCTGGFNREMDIAIMGANEIYSNPTTVPIYHTQSYDPEGLLGSFNSTFLTYLGLLVGDFFVAYQDKIKRIFYL